MEVEREKKDEEEEEVQQLRRKSKGWGKATTFVVLCVCPSSEIFEGPTLFSQFGARGKLSVTCVFCVQCR